MICAATTTAFIAIPTVATAMGEHLRMLSRFRRVIAVVVAAAHVPHCLILVDLAIHRHRSGDHAPDIAHVTGHDHGRPFLCELPKRIDVFLRHAETHRSLSALLAVRDASRHGIDSGGGGLGFHEDGLSLTVGGIDLFGLQRFGSKDDALLAAFRDVDGTLSLTLRLENLGSLASLSRHLAVHRRHDALRGVNIPDLVPETDHPPGLRGFVDGLRDVGVERGPLFEHVVERELADLRAHRGLGQLRDGVLGIFDSIAVDENMCQNHDRRSMLGMRNSAYLALYASNTRVYNTPSSSNVTLSAVMAL